MRVSYQQIYQAEQKCSKSKRKGSQCQRFNADLIGNLFEIQQVLQSKTYVPKPMRVFVADNGSKPREIYAPHYYDRVIHHTLVPRLEKIITHKFIHDSCANQKNKGTHFAIKRLQKMMRKSSLQGLLRQSQSNPSLRGGTTWQSPESSVVHNRLPQSYLLRNDSDLDASNENQINSCKMDSAHHLGFIKSPSYLYDGQGSSYAKPAIFKQSKLKSCWIEFHQKKLPLILKKLQQQSVSYVVATQQGYVNNKLRKRKVSQIYISNNLNPKEAI